MQFNTGANPDANTFGASKPGFRTSAPFSAAQPATMNAILGELALAVEAFAALNPSVYTQLSTILTTLLNNAGGSTTLQQSSSTPVFATPNNAHQHPSSASNKWKLILRAPQPDGTHIRLYAGDDTGLPGGSWCITNNAQWNPASGDQNWTSENTGQSSSALLADRATIYWLVRAAGAGSWTAWDAANADAHIAGDLTVAGDATAANHVTNGEFNYSTPPTRRVRLPMASVTGASLFLANFGEYILLQPSDVVVFPVPVRTGATLGQVRVLMAPNTIGADAEIRALRQHGGSMATVSPALPTYTVVDSETGIAMVGAHSNGAVSFGGLVAAAAETYHIAVNNPSGADDLRLYAIDVEITDPGPRNY